jgi:hypothetical protein
MPIEKELSKLPKQWICNVAYSLIGDPFRDWVMHQVEARNQKQAVERNLNIAVDPTISALLMASTHVSRK